MSDDASSASPANPGLFQHLGPLRLAIAVGVVLCAPLAWWAGDDYSSDLGLLATYVAPAVAVILAWVLLLDMLMARIFLSQSEARARLGYRRVLAVNAGLFLVLIAAWLPFFVALFD